MIACGVSIAASEAILVWIDGVTRAPLLGVAQRVSLQDPYSRQDLQQTSEVLRQLVTERKTDLIVIRKSSTAGKFRASHVAYRMETLLILAAGCEIRFTSAQAVASFVKREKPALPEALRAYQHDAYLAALAGLTEA
jgi:hypothetical protein